MGHLNLLISGWGACHYPGTFIWNKMAFNHLSVHKNGQCPQVTPVYAISGEGVVLIFKTWGETHPVDLRYPSPHHHRVTQTNPAALIAWADLWTSVNSNPWRLDVMSIILIGQSSPCSLGEAICSLFVSAANTCMDAGCQFIRPATPSHSFVLLNNTVFYHLSPTWLRVQGASWTI